jgi:hypothetical protein
VRTPARRSGSQTRRQPTTRDRRRAADNVRIIRQRATDDPARDNVRISDNIRRPACSRRPSCNRPFAARTATAEAEACNGYRCRRRGVTAAAAVPALPRLIHRPPSAVGVCVCRCGQSPEPMLIFASQVCPFQSRPARSLPPSADVGSGPGADVQPGTLASFHRERSRGHLRRAATRAGSCGHRNHSTDARRRARAAARPPIDREAAGRCGRSPAALLRREAAAVRALVRLFVCLSVFFVRRFHAEGLIAARAAGRAGASRRSARRSRAVCGTR